MGWPQEYSGLAKLTGQAVVAMTVEQKDGERTFVNMKEGGSTSQVLPAPAPNLRAASAAGLSLCGWVSANLYSLEL